MYIKPDRDIRRLQKAALHENKCDLTIGNIRIFDVFTGAITPGSIDILDGIIVDVRENETEDKGYADQYIDGNASYCVPGFIDTHIHVESTMMIPENFGRAVIPYGTTTVLTDPHEAANVAGKEGVEFMLRSGQRTPLRHFVLCPSCVPSVPGLEGNGASFTAKEVGEILDLPDVVGLAEVMDYINVYKSSERMLSIVAEARKRDKFIQGHAPRLTGSPLNAYILAGIENDHECRSRQECALKQRMGMKVNLKSSSLSNHLAENLEAVKKQRWRDSVSICTDDVVAKKTVQEGHINRIIREAISYGLDSLDAYRCATYNAAREYRIRDLGAIAPGYVADLQLLKEMDGSTPTMVFIEGKLVAQNGVPCFPEPSEPIDIPTCPIDLDYIQGPQDFELTVPGNDYEALVIYSKENGSPFNFGHYEKVPVQNHKVSLVGDDTLAYICVCNRYGTKQKTIGLIRNFGLKEGAFASTVAHDCHNLIMVYKDPEDAYVAARALADEGGGFCVANHGKVQALLKLPVFGLMSTHSGQEMVDEITALEDALKVVSDDTCYMMKMATSALPVLPGTVITDKGIVDGKTQQYISLFRKA